MTMLRPSVATDTKRPGWCETTFRIGRYDDPADVMITAWEGNDGGDDVAPWATNPIHVQIDTDEASRATGVVVHLNDGPPIYQGNPEVHDSAAEVLRQVRAMLDGSLYATRPPSSARVNDALNLIKRSGVVL